MTVRAKDKTEPLRVDMPDKIPISLDLLESRLLRVIDIDYAICGELRRCANILLAILVTVILILLGLGIQIWK